jgi:hypothetical protein
MGTVRSVQIRLIRVQSCYGHLVSTMPPHSRSRTELTDDEEEEEEEEEESPAAESRAGQPAPQSP